MQFTNYNQEQLNRMRTGKGFIAALDQSGGSTPKALLQYGIGKDQYCNDEEMFALMHEMRTRIIKSPTFTSEYILGAILFENTMNRQIDGLYTADFLWQKKGVVPFLKVDKGLSPVQNGVQLMLPIDHLDDLLKRAVGRNIFGTKMRSVIKEAKESGIRSIVEQQFELGKQIASHGLVPILEPEVDIGSADKEASEHILKEELMRQLKNLSGDMRLMLKLSIPTQEDFYKDLIDDPHVLRVVALSGGYSQHEANKRLAQNHGLIASFSRALAEGLTAQQTDEEFDALLKKSILSIYEASIT